MLNKTRNLMHVLSLELHRSFNFQSVKECVTAQVRTIGENFDTLPESVLEHTRMQSLNIIILLNTNIGPAHRYGLTKSVLRVSDA